ncbi:hypothetical protein B0H34DRAFT_71837 [Crassisporium funariophilum]|nr:hypothetical protein B0H34DRAFT_71837 [Crassisporium funariophilum]
MAPASRLPNELLCIIFEDMYNDSQAPVVEGAIYPEPPTWIDKDLYSPALFPFCIAMVCRRWRDVLAQRPEMWTRIVLDVDADPTPLLGAFSWSKNQPIEVCIVSRGARNGARPEARLENQRVWAITELLIPHIRRCSAIVYDVTYASSLPTLGLIFRQSAHGLGKLKVVCRIEDGDHNGALSRALEARVYANVWPTCNYSGLGLISVSGRLFMEWGRTMPLFFHHLQAEVYSYKLAISQFAFQEEAEDNHEGYTLSRFLVDLSGYSHFKEVILQDLTLSYPARSFRTLPLISMINLKQLTLRNLEGNFLAEFFTLACIRCTYLKVDRCIIPELQRSIKPPALWVGHMADTDSLVNLLCSWSGSSLTLVKCPAFNDAVLDVLAAKGKDGEMFKEARDGRLIVDGCPDFTAAALRRLIAARKEAMVRTAIYPIHTIVVSYGEPLSEEDKVWFEELYPVTLVAWLGHQEGQRCPSPDEDDEAPSIIRSEMLSYRRVAL